MKDQARNFRLCIISEVDKGERIVTEVKYDLEKGNIIVNEEKKVDD